MLQLLRDSKLEEELASYLVKNGIYTLVNLGNLDFEDLVPPLRSLLSAKALIREARKQCTVF